MHHGVMWDNGNPANTPHHLYVEDGVYCKVFEKNLILWASAASVETLFCLIGDSDLSQCQDPVSWDKLLEMIINFVNQILGLLINTRTMRGSIPSQYLVLPMPIGPFLCKGGSTN